SEAVAPLIEWGCDVSRPESRGLTPLHLATIHQKANMVRALLDAGANVDARDNWGNTPLGRAVMNCDGVDGSCIRLLLAAGADRNLANNHGVSPLSLAGTIANHDLVQFFK